MSEKPENILTDMANSGVPPPTDQQKEMANQAYQEFEKGQFGTCVSIMNKLASQRLTDSKVLHNKAVAFFFQNNQCSVEELRQCLQNLSHLVYSHIYF